MNIRKVFAPVIIVSTLVGMPLMNRGRQYSHESYNDVFVKELKEEKPASHEHIIDNMEIISESNFRGGISYKYNDSTVQVLKKLIQKPQGEIEYILPIENSKNVFLDRKSGMFGSPRPGGRPHLGLDIFVSKNARKPLQPVKIISPVDGVVISHKRAREKDNVIANSVTILGVDGRRYAFDHLARGTDYNDSIPLPQAGTIIKRGDDIGYVGNTGETALWHLHLAIMTDEEKIIQEADKNRVALAKQTKYAPIKGQVDPLDREKAGPIADLLNTYKK